MLATNHLKWVWVNTYRYICSGMNIHLPAIWGFTARYQGFDPSPNENETDPLFSALSLGIPSNPRPWRRTRLRLLPRFSTWNRLGKKRVARHVSPGRIIDYYPLVN